MRRPSSTRQQRIRQTDRVDSPAAVRLQRPSSLRTNGSRMAASWPCVRAPFSEDGLTASFAGQQESYLNVRGGDAVLDRVRECWASFFSPRALFYRAQKAVLADTRMAVVVQEMVQADKSGVMFTVDPIRNRRDCMVIEGAPGLGEAIVSGEITPDHYVVSREEGVIVEVFIPDDERGRVLSEHELDGLRRLGLRLEAFFGSPQDVEWCIRGGELLLLQSRPITTLGAHG